jgi:integrase
MLTDVKIRALRRRKREYTKTDRDGLSLRVLPSGKKIWQYRYHLPGQRKQGHRFTYGHYPDLSLVAARALHAEAVKKVRLGIDLNAEKRTAITETIVAPTVEAAFVEYDAAYLATLKKPKLQRRMFKTDILPVVGHVKVKDLNRRHVSLIIDPIVTRGAAVSANRTLAAFKSFLRYCVEKGIIDSNPADAVTQRSAGGREKSRDRHLAPADVRRFWHGTGINEQFHTALKLLLLTAVRIGELCKAEWADIDLNAKTWRIPAQNAKTGVEHTVPLSDLALELFTTLKDIAAGSRYVLPSVLSDRATKAPSITVALQRTGCFGIDPPFTPHDLRRTAATLMGEAGVLPFIVEAVLNHKVRGVAGIYNHSQLADEKRKALATLAEKVKQAITEKPIISLEEHRAAKTS